MIPRAIIVRLTTQPVLEMYADRGAEHAFGPLLRSNFGQAGLKAASFRKCLRRSKGAVLLARSLLKENAEQEGFDKGKSGHARRL